MRFASTLRTAQRLGTSLEPRPRLCRFVVKFYAGESGINEQLVNGVYGDVAHSQMERIDGCIFWLVWH
jgi:hypothetical protein